MTVRGIVTRLVGGFVVIRGDDGETRYAHRCQDRALSDLREGQRVEFDDSSVPHLPHLRIATAVTILQEVA